jgi:class 3 adenylate cyclase
VDYITKPFVPPLLLKRIEVHILLQAQKQVIRRAFSTYLSEEVVEEVLSDPRKLQLGGVKRNISALFTDIQDFTPISQNMDPEDLISMLNAYLSVMSGIILEQQGTIDKYEGDAIISFFGAPIEIKDHAFRAALAAINMKRAEKDLHIRFAKEGISPLPIRTRIGINTGEMVTGNMGTRQKMNYTIIGNNVNIASRLEGVNKLYGTWILASEATVRKAGERIISRRLDRVRVVGIDAPIRLYELLELRERCSDDIFTLVRLSEEALIKFEARDWVAATAAFEAVLKHSPTDSPAKLYLQRCENFRSSPPRDAWDGVFNLTIK